MTPPAVNAARGVLRGLYRAAVAAVDPAQLVERHVERENDEAAAGADQRHLIVGAGKAAARMALGCERVIGADRVCGEVIVADGCGVPLASIRVSEAGHPVPDGRGEAATRRIMELVRRPDVARIICLVSGGASSLLVCPLPSLTLQEKIDTTRLLLACGAAIDEVNTVRKHLSSVKGGELARLAVRPLVTYVLSDVVGDDPSTIGSGPTVTDPTGCEDALRVLRRYRLLDRIPKAVLQCLSDRAAGGGMPVAKFSGAGSETSAVRVIGSNRTALGAATQAARELGWPVVLEDAPIVGDTVRAAREFAARLRGAAAHSGAPLCVVAGGETTVEVRGGGRGGRNQEFGLALAPEIAGLDVAVLSAGTDGIDGPTDAAGAFVDGRTVERAVAQGLRLEESLANNDSYTFFAALDDLFVCGPTGTNVMDIKLALVNGGSAARPAGGR